MVILFLVFVSAAVDVFEVVKSSELSADVVCLSGSMIETDSDNAGREMSSHPVLSAVILLSSKEAP